MAAGQTLGASDGVGLLANYTLSSFGSGVAITGVTVPGDATTYDPSEPIVVEDVGTLLVNSDGGFTFVPDGSATGAFLFRFDFSDGTNTGHGTGALWVGGSGAVFVPNELTAAADGTLTYERELTGFAPATDYFTVHDVPFHSAVAGVAGGPLGIVYAIFGMKLADVRDAVHVQVSTELDPKVVESKLVDFTFADGQDLVVHIADVRYALHAAIGDIESALASNYSESSVKDAIDRWFQGQELEDSDAPTQQQVGTILSVYQFVAGDLDGREIRYVNKRGASGYGSLYGKNPDFAGVIEVGDLYFGTTVGTTFTEATSATRFGTVIHELTHTDSENLGHTDDWGGYFSNLDDVSSDLAPVTWWHDEQIYPTTATLIGNADSYARYLTQYYFLGVPNGTSVVFFGEPGADLDRGHPRHPE